MSLLLDALKKAADDKKNSVDEPADKSRAQDNSHTTAEDSLELELDEKQIMGNERAEDNDFPQFEDQPIVDQPIAKQTQQTKIATNIHAAAEAASASTDKPQPDSSPDLSPIKYTQDTGKPADSDATAKQQSAEPQLTATQTAEPEVANNPEQKHTRPKAGDADTAATDSTHNDLHTATEAVHSVSSAVSQADRTRNRADNEAALSALINKSNQYRQRAQRKHTILLVTLILLLISGSAGFFYVKADMASQELYITQSNNTPLLREPATVTNNSQAADTQTAVTDASNNKTRTAEAARASNAALHNRSSEASVSKPRTTQTAKPARNAIASKPAETEIHIQQSRQKDPVASLIMDGYSAFQRGDYARAETLYQQVLADEPRNRDATLGLAAIALKQQRYEYAKQKYLALLQLNPKDSLAIAGLSSLSQGGLQHASDTALSESQLKFMLKEQPDAAHLYFALGSLYAAKNQWPQAQSAYFSAWSGDNNKADYTFNLAVSLDHINQPQQALHYYQLSLKLIHNSAANFSTTQVQQRINSLQEAMR